MFPSTSCVTRPPPSFKVSAICDFVLSGGEGLADGDASTEAIGDAAGVGRTTATSSFGDCLAFHKSSAAVATTTSTTAIAANWSGVRLRDKARRNVNLSERAD